MLPDEDVRMSGCGRALEKSIAEEDAGMVRVSLDD